MRLHGCAHMGSLGLLAGKSVHGFVVRNEWELNVDIGSVLVHMYAKCGFLKNAVWVFDLMQERNVSNWTALICGFCQEALSLFKMMQEAGVRPNEMTFTGILNACAHKGMLEEGRKYFKMIKDTGLEPRIQHYGCMVDMFGCKEHKQLDIADRVIGQVLKEIKPENDGGVYSLVSDLYVLNEKWDDAERSTESQKMNMRSEEEKIWIVYDLSFVLEENIKARACSMEYWLARILQ
ncbi:unnamed protein product [Dovyalis caffra]|uniref:Pentatricopeptide repeat-containing protein n=1 Tax=Dovyalis caffra TaxID=77055 RepID=A0AAV1RHL9_9ROSI|nr:unnamed protein product [Dovyalis caffra]